MSQRKLASVLFAVLGVFIAATRVPEFLLQLGLYVQMLEADMDVTEGFSPTVYSIQMLVSTGIAVILGLSLVRVRDSLASRLFPTDSAPLAAEETQAVALSVLGCYFVIVGICALIWIRGVNWGGAVQLVLGIGLFLGARGVARLWSVVRSGRAGSNDERAV